jgi:hypothetical protein
MYAGFSCSLNTLFHILIYFLFLLVTYKIENASVIKIFAFEFRSCNFRWCYVFYTSLYIGECARVKQCLFKNAKHCKHAKPWILLSLSLVACIF